MIEKILNYYIENKIKKLPEERFNSLFLPFSKNINEHEFRYFFKKKNSNIILKRNLKLAVFKVTVNYRSRFIDIETDRVLFTKDNIEYIDGDIVVCDFNSNKAYYTYKKNTEYVLVLLRERHYNKNPEVVLDDLLRQFKVISNTLELEKNNYYLAKIKDCSSYHITSSYNYIKIDLIKKICDIDDPAYRSYKILLRNSIPFITPENVYESVKDLDVTKDLSKNRIDYTDHLTFTIDGIDSKDFDDAISLKLEKDYFYLGIHIADVSNYVLQSKELDELAYQRQTSIYLHQLTIPMLIDKLSNDICSLVENKERLTISVMYKYSYDFKLLDFSINKAKIISNKRLNYDLVNNFYNDNSISEIPSDIKQALLFLDNFNQFLEIKKEKRGYLKFDTSELKFGFEGHLPVKVYLKKQGKSELLIENLMVLANETVSKFLTTLELPCPYRVHEEPELTDLDNVLNFFKTFGIDYKIKLNYSLNKIYKDLLSLSLEHKNKEILQNYLIRSMPKALYTDVLLGHFGLSLKYYSHFTSPIRRYPDLLLHKILTELVLDVNNYEERLKYYQDNIKEILRYSSLMERKALTVERESEKLMSIIYLSLFKRRFYKALIVSTTSTGFYCLLEENNITGFLRLNNLNEYFKFYEDSNCYIGSKGTIYKLGDTIKVKVLSLNEDKLLIDLGVYNEVNNKQ